MRRATKIATCAVLLAFAGLWAAFAQTKTDIASVDQIGWWSRRPGALPLNSAAFEVAAGVQGEESIAALRVLIRGDISKATLVLAEADAPLSAVTPGKLRVCTTSAPWLKADGGAYADAPKPDCTAAVELTRAADPTGAATWTGDITAMLAGPRSEVSLMVLPSLDPSAVLPPTYFIKLTGRVAAEGTPDVAPTSTTPSATPVVPGASVGASGPRVPSPTAPTANVPPSTAPAPAPADGTTAATPRRFTVVAARGPGKPWGKLVLLVPLAAIAALLYTGGRKFCLDRLATS